MTNRLAKFLMTAASLDRHHAFAPSRKLQLVIPRYAKVLRLPLDKNIA